MRKDIEEGWGTTNRSFLFVVVVVAALVAVKGGSSQCFVTLGVGVNISLVVSVVAHLLFVQLAASGWSLSAVIVLVLGVFFSMDWSVLKTVVIICCGFSSLLKFIIPLSVLGFRINVHFYVASLFFFRNADFFEFACHDSA